jgi:hypothetical protein
MRHPSWIDSDVKPYIPDGDDISDKLGPGI